MKNNKGFTLTEVLLAAMIVGIIGIALAALTTAALRESGTGRVRLMLRNQISLFVRQLRQDVRGATSVTVTEEENGKELKLTRQKSLGPAHSMTTITYVCQNGYCKRNGETVLNYVQTSYLAGWEKPFTISNAGSDDSVGAILKVNLIVGMNSDKPIKEALEEIIILPQGFPVKQQEN